MPLVIGFDEVGATDIASVGGKAASLGRLVALGFKVPPGFTLGTAAHSEFLHSGTLARDIHALLGGLDTSDAVALETCTARLRALIEGAPIPAAIVTAILSAYAGLGREVNVAVRSSGTAEDLAQASFAGMYDTYLDVRGAEAVVAAVRRCWASMWTARVTAYRHQLGFDGEAERLAVVVQEMVEPTAAGVMFTANPMSARTDEIVINASWGLVPVPKQLDD